MTALPDTEAARPLYEMHDVRRVYRTGGGEVRAVDGIDLTVERGEFLAIEGPSGSGKSTLLQLLGVLDKPTSGTLLFDGHDLTQLDERSRTGLRSRDVGFVFQTFNLIPTLTAAENVEAAMVPLVHDRDERRTRVAALLERVGLAPRSMHLPSTMSGGEQQRVAIARALANEPRVILADEPTGNLDSTTAEEVVATLRSLSTEQGVTVIVVTHAEDIARQAQRRVRLRDGRVVEGNATGLAPSPPVDESFPNIPVIDLPDEDPGGRSPLD
ncbi:MAG: ABC transporter ATP-binding protein [Acidimicrobiia bacterium]